MTQINTQMNIINSITYDKAQRMSHDWILYYLSCEEGRISISTQRSQKREESVRLSRPSFPLCSL